MASQGHDLSCTLRTVPLVQPDGSTRLVTAVQPTLDMAEVSERTCLIEALIRRITTPRGTLIDVVIPSTTANYGTAIDDFLNDDIDARGLAQIGAAVDAELKKDERVVRSSTAATLVGAGAAATLILTITVVDGAGPFQLVLAVTAETVQLLAGAS